MSADDMAAELGHSVATSADRIVSRIDSMTRTARLARQAVHPIGKGTDNAEAQDAAEAAIGAALRVVTLAFEVAHESGRMLAAASARDQLSEGGDDGQ